MCRDKWFTAEQEEMAQMGQPGRKARNCNLRPSDRVRMTAGRPSHKHGWRAQ